MGTRYVFNFLNFALWLFSIIVHSLIWISSVRAGLIVDCIIFSFVIARVFPFIEKKQVSLWENFRKAQKDKK